MRHCPPIAIDAQFESYFILSMFWDEIYQKYGSGMHFKNILLCLNEYIQ